MSTGYPASYRTSAGRRGFQPIGRGPRVLFVKPPGVFLAGKVPAFPWSTETGRVRIPDAGPNFMKSPIGREVRLIGTGINMLRGLARGQRILPLLQFVELALELYQMWNTDPPGTTWSAKAYGAEGYQVCTPPCVGRTPTHIKSTTLASCVYAPSGCGLTNQAIGPNLLFGQTVPASHRQVTLWEFDHFVAGVGRYNFVQEFIKPAGAQMSPAWLQMQHYQPLPSWIPSLDPETIPIQKPAPAPLPVPQRVANRRVSERLGQSPARQAGYGLPEVVVQPPPPVPSVIVDVDVATGAVRSRLTTRPHRKVPPKKREKERKPQSPFQPTRAMGVALNVLTESLDAIDALWWALPKSVRGMYQGKRASGTEKIGAIWRHFGEIDLHQAAINLIINDVGDTVIGRLNRAAHKSWYRSAVGALRAPRAGPYQLTG